jgi:hypothetical protein
MSLEMHARQPALAWSNPVICWWGFLTLVSAANIAIWVALYRTFGEQQAGALSSSSEIGLMLLLCAGYVFGCAFRSILPRADVQRICLFDTWLSSVVVGRSVATVAELCLAAQWAVILNQLGAMTNADTTLNIALMIFPLLVIAECFSWYAVLTTNYLGNAIENSIWAVAFFLVGVALCRLLPEFHGVVRAALIAAIACTVLYLAFLVTVDVPMYFNRWRAARAGGKVHLPLFKGLRDISTRWVVTHDLAEWKEEIAWMSLYFSGAVWASLALVVFCALGDQLPRYRNEVAAAPSHLVVVDHVQPTSRAN